MGSQLDASGQISITSSAKHEPDISTSHAYTDIILINLTAKTSWSSEVSTAITEFLEGCGRVDLLKMHVKVIPTATSQSIYIATCSTANNNSAETLSGMQNGYSFVSNSFTVGIERSFDLIPMDNLSMQIRPVSASLPMMQIKMEKTAAMRVWLTLYVKVLGVRQHVKVLN